MGKIANKVWLWLKIVLGTVLGLLVLVLIALRLILTPAFLTKAVNKYAAPLVDGELSFGQIDASVFSTFPNVKVSIDDALLTYPHDRFSRYDSLYVQSRYRERGRGEEADTLALFSNLSASVNLPALASGRIHVHEVLLSGAKIFAHQYAPGEANWNVFGSGEKEEEDTVATSLPHIIIHRVALMDKPRVVFTSAADTIFASVRMKEMAFNGRFDIADMDRHRIDFSVDSLFVSGRLPADTLALRLDRLAIDQKGEEYDVLLRSKAYLRMRSIGRMRVPVDLSGRVSFPQNDFNDITVKDLAARVATVSLRGDADVKMRPDSTYLKAEITIDTCSVDKTIKYFSRNLSPAVKKLHTDAVITLTALCDGWWIPSENCLPELVAELMIPKAAVAYDGIEYKGRLAADINAMTDKWGKLNVSLDELEVDIKGASLSGAGSADDVLCDDPLVQLDVMADASLEKLDYIMPEGIKAQGDVNAALSGMILLSDLNLYNFAGADLEGFVDSDGINIIDEPDSISAYLGKTSISLGKAGEGAALGADKLGLKGQIDSLYAVYKDDTVIKGSKVRLTAQNADNVLSEQFGTEIHPIVGSLAARNLTMTGRDSLFLSIRGTNNSFKYSNRMDGGKTLPVLAFTSANRGIFLRSGVNRIGLRGTTINASAFMKGAEKTARRDKLLDSLQRVYPAVERDSLLRHHFRIRRAGRQVPDYLSEADFREKDIRLDLGQTVTSYFNDWTLSGALKVDRGSLATPYFPLRNRFSSVGGRFDNNNLVLDSLTFQSGVSDVSASGKVTGLQRAVAGRGRLDVDLALTSKLLDANELLAAYDAGSRYVPPKDKSAQENLTDDEYLDKIVSDASADTSGRTLIVLPANLNANLTLQGDEIRYSDLDITWFASDIKMKQRTLQITNTVAASNMGDIYFEGFYSSRTKKDISAGFDLNLVDITADKVITLIPEVDSILPMLKTFKGMLDCELAATTKLDTAMNFLTPTINGVMSIKGSDLSIKDDGAFRKIANILMFKDKSIGKIEDMSVQGLISNNTLAVFPFVLSVDRYSLAMSGLQNFDRSFDYHVSVLKSPLPFRFGVDLFGNFDKWKWKLVKARYKDANVPVFTREMNDMQMNLVSSIHNIFTRGVEEAVRANAASGGALSSASSLVTGSGSEQLDASQAGQLDSLRYAYDHPEESQPVDSLLNARIDAVMDSMRSDQPEKKECWLRRLFRCKKKDAALKEDEQ